MYCIVKLLFREGGWGIRLPFSQILGDIICERSLKKEILVTCGTPITWMALLNIAVVAVSVLVLDNKSTYCTPTIADLCI